MVGGGKGNQNHDKMAAILPELYTKYRANLQAVHTEDNLHLLNTTRPSLTPTFLHPN